MQYTSFYRLIHSSSPPFSSAPSPSCSCSQTHLKASSIVAVISECSPSPIISSIPGLPFPKSSTLSRTSLTSSSAWMMDTSVLDEDEQLDRHIIRPCRSCQRQLFSLSGHYCPCRFPTLDIYVRLLPVIRKAACQDVTTIANLR